MLSTLFLICSDVLARFTLKTKPNLQTALCIFSGYRSVMLKKLADLMHLGE